MIVAEFCLNCSSKCTADKGELAALIRRDLGYPQTNPVANLSQSSNDLLGGKHCARLGIKIVRRNDTQRRFAKNGNAGPSDRRYRSPPDAGSTLVSYN
jgi:hypothetical protein